MKSIDCLVNKLSYDLHIHSCLSPCGDEDMTPANIMGMAAVKQLEVVALTDHNSCKNCVAAEKHAKDYGIMFLPGMELTTIEEVHVLCLFQTVEEAMKFDSYVGKQMGEVENVEEIFGRQLICNDKDEMIGKETNLLIQSTKISFDEVYPLMEEYHGVMIPAHIDKDSHSVLYNLGFVPEGSKFRAAELVGYEGRKSLFQRHPYLGQCLCLKNSDAHYLEKINEPENFLWVERKSMAAVFSLLRHGK